MHVNVITQKLFVSGLKDRYSHTPSSFTISLRTGSAHPVDSHQMRQNETERNEQCVSKHLMSVATDK